MCIHYAAQRKSQEKCQDKCRFHVFLMGYLSGQDCLAAARIRRVSSTTGKSFLQSEKISLMTIHLAPWTCWAHSEIRLFKGP
jgi:hypothetical protein